MSLDAHMRLSDERLILTDADRVRVITPSREAVEIRGRRVDLLHARLLPHLSRFATVAQMVTCLPTAHAEPVRTYLEALRRAGALVEDETAGEGLSRRRRPAAPGRSCRVRFTTASRAAKALFLCEPGGPPVHQVCIVPRGGHSSRARSSNARRAARWLQHRLVAARALAAAPATLPEVSLYELDDRSPRLQLLVTSGDHRGGPDDQLDLIKWWDIEQIPLAAATAAHHGFATRVSGCSVERQKLAEYLVRHFIALEFLRHARRRPDRKWLIGRIGEPPDAASSTQCASRRFGTPRVASSLPGLEMQLLEDALRSSPCTDHLAAAAQRDDLLTVAVENDWSTYLQAVLRLRRSCLRGCVTRRADGVWRASAGTWVCESLVRERAVAELLVAATWDAFYAHGARQPRPPCGWWHSDFVDADAQHAILDEITSALGGRGHRPPFWAREVKRWGISTWVGGLLKT